MTDRGQELLRPEEARRLLGVSNRTLARWEDRGLITAQRTLGGHRRYRRADIEELVARGGTQA